MLINFSDQHMEMVDPLNLDLLFAAFFEFFNSQKIYFVSRKKLFSTDTHSHMHNVRDIFLFYNLDHLNDLFHLIVSIYAYSMAHINFLIM